MNHDTIGRRVLPRSLHLSIVILATASCSGAEPQRFTAEFIKEQASAFTNNFGARGPRTGRAVAIEVSPANDLISVVAAESGGLSITNNGGTTWTHVDSLSQFRIRDVKFASQDGNTIIVSTYNDTHTVKAAGIWRSSDGGTTWAQPKTATPPCSPNNTAAATWGISYDSRSGNIYVGTDCGVAKSTDAGVTWRHTALAQGVYSVVGHGTIVDVCAADGHHRSIDSGASFGPAHGIGAAGGCWGNPHRIDVSPNDDNVLFSAPSQRSLFESDDGGTSWTALANVSTCPGGGRASWVKTHASRDGNRTHFDLHFSDGVGYQWDTCTHAGPGTRCDVAPVPTGNCAGWPYATTSWKASSVVHSDFSGIAFGKASQCPQYFASDGGILVTSDCGATLSYGSMVGYVAAQIYDMVGQAHPSNTNLYVGMQDNGVWASSILGRWTANPFLGGDAFFLSLATSDPSIATETVVGLAPLAFRAGASLSNLLPWPTSLPPGSTFLSPAFVISPNNYACFAMKSSGSPPSLYTGAASGSGGSVSVNWSNRLNLSLKTNENIYGERFQVGGPSSSPIVYQPTDQGLIAVSDVLGTPKMSRADGGLQLIGRYWPGEGPFRAPFVLGADPQVGTHAIVADMGAGQMKVTYDGGLTWGVDATLTSLVTQNGALQFRHPVLGSQAHVIAFDPYHPNRILVGTEAAGVLFSQSAGQTWSKLPDSDRVTVATGFVFDDIRGFIYASTYGRGVFKLRMPAPTRDDFDGDGRTDLSVFRPSENNWYVSPSTGATPFAIQFGILGDILVPGDYSGDGKTDTAVFRPSNLTWYVWSSGTSDVFATQWGIPGDVPVPADYDGDGRMDLAVWRPSEAKFHILQSSTNTERVSQWGLSGDIPVPGDYDGDGVADLAVWRSSTEWIVQLSSGAPPLDLSWGIVGDKPVLGDYDGDGKIDLALWRGFEHNWYIRYSGNGYAIVPPQQVNATGDIPVPGDYDGDGITDLAVFATNSASWSIVPSGKQRDPSGQFGIWGDQPIPAF